MRVRARSARLAVAVSSVLALPLGVVALAAPAAAGDDATVTILYAIPSGSGPDLVDVYSGKDLLVDNASPGDLTAVNLAAGLYDVGVYADGDVPGQGSPLVEAKAVKVSSGQNVTVTANLDDDGAPAMNVFVNQTTTVKGRQATLTVRHIAAAPAVDVVAAGKAIVKDLANAVQFVVVVPAGQVSADVNLAGTDTIAIGPADLDLRKGTNTIVYAWGSAAAGNLALTTQVVDTVEAVPTAVNAGGGSSAPDSGVPLWAIAAIVAGAVGVLAAGTRLIPRRAR